ncbi:uncharacterized protein LOC115628296 [Scaptodrosophila lebanonensis]|uniref:Uncharacterized protein LOC115628296 n=1 Tax=Drosophila lebanonensis TaxID=7225 RepID=A0A6J2TVQ6_DROLE|nr:uncharacterized protein LOC115628296 [Scaptodrosophila lebanonensis]
MSIKKIMQRLPVGKKHKQIAISFLPSAAVFGLAAGMALVYYTDWKVVAKYLPIYNTKFPKEEEEK